MKKTIAKPSDIKELDVRPVDALEIKTAEVVEKQFPELASYIHRIARELHFLRRDYDHLHAVVEKMYNEEELD